MSRSPLLFLAVLYLFLPVACAKKKVEEVASTPVAPVQPPPPPPPPARVYPEPIEFLPATTTIAVGFRPSSFDESTFCKSLAAQMGPIVALTERLGFKLPEIESLWLSSDAANACLACMRTVQPFDIAATVKRIAPDASSQPARAGTVLTWASTANEMNAVALVDDRTLLVGRKSSVDQALARPGDGPARLGYTALLDKTPIYWVAGNQATAADQAGRIALVDFQDKVRGLAGFNGFASSVKFDGGLAINMSLVLQSGNEAGVVRELLESPQSSVPLKPSDLVQAGGANGQTKGRRLESKIPEFGAAIPVRKVSPEGQGGTIHLKFESSSTLLSIGPEVLRATGASVQGDGLFEGVLGSLGKAIEARRSAGELPGVVFPENFEGHANAGYSWMCHLLPYVGHQDIYDQFKGDFKKSWTEDPDRFILGCQQIGEFLNPANPRVQWKGYPYPGLALTHFVGISGVERKDSDVAARFQRTDPRAGVFGYDRAAKNEEITDGLAQTIMIAGNDRFSGPWIEGGGSTIRGARNKPFDDFAGFHSEGLEKPGVYVLLADGSSRIVSADCDPKIFQAMCTTHGGETIDLAKVPATIRSIIAPPPSAGAGVKP